MPYQKASASPCYHTCNKVLEGLGKSKEKIFVLSKIRTFLTWDLGTWTAQHLGTHVGFRKSVSGNAKIQAAYHSCCLLCLLLWVFRLSVSHRQSPKLMAGWKSLERSANIRFEKINYSLISRLSSGMLILKICHPTVQLCFTEYLTKSLLTNIVYDFYDTLVLQ